MPEKKLTCRSLTDCPSLWHKSTLSTGRHGGVGEGVADAVGVGVQLRQSFGSKIGVGVGVGDGVGVGVVGGGVPTAEAHPVRSCPSRVQMHTSWNGALTPMLRVTCSPGSTHALDQITSM